jgi:uncharacterized protein (DUF4415 family)
LAKVDAHEVGSGEYEELPEWTDEMFDRADFKIAGKTVRRGRPASPSPKQHINIRLSARVVEHFKATGPGWQGRIDAALLEWIERHGR